MRPNKFSPRTTRRTRWISVIYLCVMCLLFAGSVWAQGPGGDPGGDPDLVPVDGGLGFLLAAGVGYGVKKVREQRRGGGKKG